MWANNLVFLSMVYASLSSENQPCNPPPKECSLNSKYRTFDGSCNNFLHQYWGAAEKPFERLVGYNYGDGIHDLPKSKSGKPLPNARIVSQKVFPHKNVQEQTRSLAHMQYGQVIAHDQSLAAGTSQIGNGSINCCPDGKLGQDGLNTDKCAPIMIEDEDPVFAPAGIECLDFERTGTDKDKGYHTPGQPVKQLNSVTSFLDLSIVYGTSEEMAKSLRTFTGGRLKVISHHGEDFPPQVDNVTQTCVAAKSQKELCFKGGDIRINQNPQLTSLQVLWLREHNRIADALSKLNPRWDDKRLYNEARRIAIAEHQHITYNEYLPLLLGSDRMAKFHLLPAKKGGCVDDYDPSVNPTMVDEHTTGGAFRYFHSAVSGHLKLMNQKRNVLEEARLSDWFNRPESLANSTILNYDRLCTGLVSQMEERVDQFFDKEITNFLFRGDDRLGTDLRALDIQRGRDHGIGTYNKMREYCNLTVPRSFSELATATGISEENAQLLKSLYGDVDDLELVVAGSLEPHPAGADAGETYLCILTENFRRSRVGDRYFYENCEEGKFTTEQLRQIRKASLSRLFCDNVHSMEKMQRKAFEPVGQGNRLLSCNLLPKVRIAAWTEGLNAALKGDFIDQDIETNSELLYE